MLESAQKTCSKNQEELSSEHSPLMTPQQKRLRSGAFSTYRQLCVGDRGIVDLLGFELYSLLFANLGGILGYGCRSLLLARLLGDCGPGVAVGKSVTIRQPARIKLGSKVIVDDFAVLDVRSLPDRTEPSIEVGDCSFIGRNSLIIAKGARIQLGRACNISSFCRLATESSIEVGESVLIAAYVYIGPGNHQLDERGRLLVEEETVKKGGVKIGDNVWIGTRATILDGVTIGSNAVIGAHSLVRDDVPEGAIVAGTPAKIINKNPG